MIFIQRFGITSTESRPYCVLDVQSTEEQEIFQCRSQAWNGAKRNSRSLIGCSVWPNVVCLRQARILTDEKSVACLGQLVHKLMCSFFVTHARSEFISNCPYFS